MLFDRRHNVNGSHFTGGWTSGLKVVLMKKKVKHDKSKHYGKYANQSIMENMIIYFLELVHVHRNQKQCK